MSGCDEDLIQQFEAMADKAHAFFEADGWKDVIHANYEAHSDVVDVEWASGMTSWEQGLYFNSGMFYGRVWNVLAKGSVI